MDDKEFKKFMVPVVILALAVVSFFILRPIANPVILGLLFAYIFYPFYELILKKVKSSNLSALIVIVVIFLVILIPLTFIFPIFIKQLFSAYTSVKTFDFSIIITNLFPSLSNYPTMASEIIAAASQFNTHLSSLMLNLFQGTILNLPSIVFDVIIILFTFFFALVQAKDFKEYFSAVFPFPKEQREKFLKRFEQVTNSVVFGHMIMGIIQGLIAGVGYYLFGIPGALLLTFLTMIAAVLPVIGAWLIWMPVDFFLFATGNSVAGMQLLIFGLFVINWVETLLRPSIVAKKADMNPAIALIGTIGGVYAFGFLGFVIGPVILASFILLIEIYKDKSAEDTIVLKDNPIQIPVKQ